MLPAYENAMNRGRKFRSADLHKLPLTPYSFRPPPWAASCSLWQSCGGRHNLYALLGQPINRHSESKTGPIRHPSSATGLGASWFTRTLWFAVRPLG